MNAHDDRALILAWVEGGLIPPDRVADALAVAGVAPTTRDWRKFLDSLLLWCGAAALGAGAIFFIAYNWSALGRWSKFLLVEALVAASILASWRLGTDKPAGQAALLLASLALGSLLALVGQTYQTGADTFELFAYWAALIVPWIMIARSAALWILWLAIVNVAVVLYFDAAPTFFGATMSFSNRGWALFAIDVAAWVAWELLARKWAWLDERWAVRVIAFTAGATVTALALVALIDGEKEATTLAVYALWLAAVYFVYRTAFLDLFVLAGGCLSLIIVITALMVVNLDQDPYITLLLCALAVIGMTAAAGRWLRKVAATEIG